MTTLPRFISTRQLVDSLGISRDTLRVLKNQNLFTPGVHFIWTGPNKGANLRWNLDEVLKTIATWDPER